MLRRRRPTPGKQPPPPTQADATTTVALWRDEGGALFAGSPDAVRAIVAQMTDVAGEQVAVSPVAPTEMLAVYATGFADGATSSQYVRFTAQSEQLLADHGAVPNGKGGFHTLVLGDHGIVGNLEWEAMTPGPERALAFQTAAVGLALRTAIKNVEAAVERVEDKVDHVIALLRAERLGNVFGDRRTLDSLVAHLDAGDPLTATDWSTVAAVGPAITRDLEKLRAHVRTQLDEVDGSWRPKQRARAADELLAQGLLAESLALLVVAEHNFSQWQHLRIHQIASHEPDRIDAAIRQARAAMEDHLAEDQQLLEQFRQAQADVLEPAALDGLAPIQTRALRRAELELSQLSGWFAEQRLLEVEPGQPRDRPDLRQSLGSLVESGLDRVPRRRPKRTELPDADADEQNEP